MFSDQFLTFAAGSYLSLAPPSLLLPLAALRLPPTQYPSQFAAENIAKNLVFLGET